MHTACCCHSTIVALGKLPSAFGDRLVPAIHPPPVEGDGDNRAAVGVVGCPSTAIGPASPAERVATSAATSAVCETVRGGGAGTWAVKANWKPGLALSSH